MRPRPTKSAGVLPQGAKDARRTHCANRDGPGLVQRRAFPLSKQAAVAIGDGVCWVWDRTACRWAVLARPPPKKDPDGCAFSTQPVRAAALQDSRTISPRLTHRRGPLQVLVLSPGRRRTDHNLRRQPLPPDRLGATDTAPTEANDLPETSGFGEGVLSESGKEARHSTTPRTSGMSEPVDRWRLLAIAAVGSHPAGDRYRGFWRWPSQRFLPGRPWP